MNQSPPQTLNQLRTLLTDIQAGKSEQRLGNRSRQVLAHLVDAPDQTAVLTSSKLAEVLGVNASTLTRLAQHLGYSGFAALQDIFRSHLAGAGHFYSGQAGRLLQNAPSSSKNLDLLQTVVEEEIANIAAMFKGANPETLEAAAKLLATAPRVRCHGLRQFYAIACFTSYALGMLRPDVSVLGDSRHGVAHGLAQLRDGDALVVVGSYPYSQGTVAAAHIAAAHGLSIIAITDSSASPLTASAKHTIIAPTNGSFFSNCMAAFLVVVESLLTLVAAKLGDQALASLKNGEELIRELNIAL